MTLNDILLTAACVFGIVFLIVLFTPKPEPRRYSPLPIRVRLLSSPLPGDHLRVLARGVQGARLKSGARVLDSSDFKEWLLECADEVDRVMVA
jgi:hypothetical protein